MNPNPFSALAHSRRFWLAILDAVLSTITYAVGLYGDAKAADMTKFLIVSYQPVFIALIVSLTAEDIATIKAQSAERISSIRAGMK